MEDTGDSSVRAIAILTSIPYAHVYERMGACMRLAGQNTSGNTLSWRHRNAL